MNDALTLMRMTPTERAAMLAAPGSARKMLQAITILNFFEEVAGEYLDGLLDRPVANRNVAFLAVTAWKDAREFIDWFRDSRALESPRHSKRAPGPGRAYHRRSTCT